MADIWKFTMAVARHWKALANGAFIITAMGILERLSGRQLTTWWYVVALVFLFFFASFLAWRDEHTRIVSLENRLIGQYPKFEVSLLQMTLGTIEGRMADGKDVHLMAYATPVVRILNIGAPSVVRGLDFFVHAPDGSVYTGKLSLPPPQLVLTNASGQNTIVVPFGEPLQEKVASRPIHPGCAEMGRLFFVFDGLSQATIGAPGITYELSVTDAWHPTTPKYIATMKWGPADELIQTFPGSGIKQAGLIPPDPPSKLIV